MKSAAAKRLLGAMALVFALTGGCRKQQNDADAIRAGITKHLASLSNLNLSAMDVDVAGVSIQGTQAHAQVTFRPKTGAPQGATMQVAYELEKRGEDWVVTKSQPAGGIIEHPAPGANPHLQSSQAGTHSQIGDLQQMIAGAAADPKTPPPGHPHFTSTPAPDDGAAKTPR
jgi:hypothetical protein